MGAKHSKLKKDFDSETATFVEPEIDENNPFFDIINAKQLSCKIKNEKENQKNKKNEKIDCILKIFEHDLIKLINSNFNINNFSFDIKKIIKLYYSKNDFNILYKNKLKTKNVVNNINYYFNQMGYSIYKTEFNEFECCLYFYFEFLNKLK